MAERIAELDKIKRRAYLATKGQGSLLRLGETLLAMVEREEQLKAVARAFRAAHSEAVGREAQLREELEQIRDDPGISEWDGWRNVGRLHDIARRALKSVGSENG